MKAYILRNIDKYTVALDRALALEVARFASFGEDPDDMVIEAQLLDCPDYEGEGGPGAAMGIQAVLP